MILADLNPEFARDSCRGHPLFENKLEHQLYEALGKLGFEFDTQVGYSGYRVDLAVVHPKNPSKYVLAIECDGSNFHSARSARERDVFRQRFLESRGWRVERVWSRNWWRDQEREVQRLKLAIEMFSA